MKQAQEVKAFQIYVTDSLWGIAHGKSCEARFAELINPSPVESRTPEEIIAHVRRKMEEAG